MTRLVLPVVVPVVAFVISIPLCPSSFADAWQANERRGAPTDITERRANTEITADSRDTRDAKCPEALAAPKVPASPEAPAAPASPDPKIEADSFKSTRLGNYVAKYKPTYDGVSEFSLYKDGKNVFTRTSQNEGFLHFVDPLDQSERTWDVPNIPVARDINGDGIPELAVLDIANDAHHSASFFILTLDKRAPRTVYEHKLVEARPAFEDMNHDGNWEINYPDDNYNCWNCMVPDSPRPNVILAWNGRTWAPSMKLMAKPKISSIELGKIVDEFKKTNNTGQSTDPWTAKNAAIIDSEVWGKMLDLIYAGNGVAARQLLKQVWTGNAVLETGTGTYTIPYTARYADRFWINLVDQVKCSDHIAAIRQLNPGLFDGPRSKKTMIWKRPF